MSEAIQLDDYIDELRGDNHPSRPGGRRSGSGGGDMDEVLKRLGAVESSVSELKVQVSGIAANIPHLATNDGLAEVRAIMPHLATNAALNDVKAAVYETETRIIKWIIASTLTAAGLAFTIAKFVH